ncbi:UNVERIFIED_CONTAM: hypothetical protein Slati_0187600 [Sesamum latifolium]|uniref:DUF4283 domain-containing protein n=1 Tax=Sesamum latifolium TaxID=2727402 RepID=A0AAW2YAZ3_9LAMI
MISPVKGMDIKQIPPDHFLFRFNHVLDRNRALEGCPWSFEKNVLVLSGINENENSMHIDLNWCEFHVHVHDLPLSKMNLGIATFIGNKIGKFKDLEMEPSGSTWGATLRIRTAINIMLPLPRALKLKTTMGEEQLVTFTKRGAEIFGGFASQGGTGIQFRPRDVSKDNERVAESSTKHQGCNLVIIEANHGVDRDRGQKDIVASGSGYCSPNVSATAVPDTQHIVNMLTDQDSLVGLENSLINVPLTFAATSGGRRGLVRRGRQMGSRTVMAARKRERGVTIIDPEAGVCHANKKRAHLVDEDSDFISAGTVEQFR